MRRSSASAAASSSSRCFEKARNCMFLVVCVCERCVLVAIYCDHVSFCEYSGGFPLVFVRFLSPNLVRICTFTGTHKVKNVTCWAICCSMDASSCAASFFRCRSASSSACFFFSNALYCCAICCSIDRSSCSSNFRRCCPLSAVAANFRCCSASNALYCQQKKDESVHTQICCTAR